MSKRRLIHNLSNHEMKARIEQIAGYISDDGYIAGYLGIPRKEVERVRREMPRRTVPRELQRSTWIHDKAGDVTGVSYERSHATSSERGSQSLHDRIAKAFAAFEARHRLIDGAGKLLLLDHPGLQRREWPASLHKGGQ